MAEFYQHASGAVYFRMRHFFAENVTDRPATDADKERYPTAWEAFRAPVAVVDEPAAAVASVDPVGPSVVDEPAPAAPPPAPEAVTDDAAAPADPADPAA